MYDVRAILYGGIPVSEVEDDYVQESLKGFDVTKVFKNRDKNYYEFKDAIDTKEKIREVLKGIDDAVVLQIERWWDKYARTLEKIENACMESETVMNKHLSELGYRR
jgi:type I restriction enzyme M protein